MLKMLYLFILLKTALSDWKYKKISNRYVIYILLLVFVQMLCSQQLSIAERIAAALIFSLPMLLISCIKSGAFGGGDIKFAAVNGLLLGMDMMLYAMWIASLTAGVYALFLLCVHKNKKEIFAFGPFLALGFGIAYL